MIKPFLNHVVLEPIKEEKKKSPIILSEDTEKQEPDRGKVLAASPFVIVNDKQATHDVKKGDIVFYKKYSGNKIKDGDKEYIVVNFQDIVAVK